MTSFNILSNDFIFPLFLLALFIYIIFFFPQTPNIEVEAVREITKDGNRLEEFYELLAQDQSLQSEIDTIGNRDLLVDYLVKISTNLGYCFTSLDINNSINENTEVSQDDYVCLPIGCWRISS